MKTALVMGAGGFIGNHLVTRLKEEGFWVRGVDRKYPEFNPTTADEFMIADLRLPEQVDACFDRDIDEVYQLAAEMGGAGYIFTGENDFDIMSSSALINLNAARSASSGSVGRLFYTSSACVYNQDTQNDTENYTCRENTAYPANPDSDYGWEKLFSERLFQAVSRNNKIPTRIGRLHNVFGPQGSWCCGREKAPAAICRKVAEAVDGGEIEMWGDGKQVRSFLYVDECLDGILRLMRSDCELPLNIGSDFPVSIRELAEMVISLSNKRLTIKAIPGPQGVRARSSDNDLIEQQLGWRPTQPLQDGLEKTYAWISDQVQATMQSKASA
ncbi:MAG: NAD-dependent epimerase/dehydratase family protein [Pseudomonadota bacterium]